MFLSNKQVGLKTSAEIYTLIRGELLITLCYEIPCTAGKGQTLANRPTRLSNVGKPMGLLGFPITGPLLIIDSMPIYLLCQKSLCQ
jgi:hypothetical protein